MNFDRFKPYAPTVLRLGIALVFLWFGSQQLLHPADWTSYIPDYVVRLSHLSVNTLVHVNGTFEALAGLFLLVGWQTRIVVALLFLHLVDILTVVRYNSVGVRDFGLTIAALAIFCYGADKFTLDYKRATPANDPQA